MFVVEGEKLVEELLKSNVIIYQIFATREWVLSHDTSSIELIEISKSELLKIKFGVLIMQKYTLKTKIVN